ncbi:MAG: TPM domain-containing protein, partial [Isosphaeraceae bacterium]
MFSLVLLVFSTISAIEVKDIVSPRPNGWVVDQTGQIHADTIKQINQIGDQVHQQLEGAEIAVVVVQTIQGRNPRQFATELFNHWGIGSKGRDNGVLVFV